jgi:uncharacterized protein (TIGR02266 family)
MSGTHAIRRVGQAEPEPSAAPPTERNRLLEAVADAEHEARQAKRDLDEVRCERDSLKLQLATALGQLAEQKPVMELDAEELLVDEEPSFDDTPTSLSRMIVSTRPAAELETDATDPNERPSSSDRRRRGRLGCEFEVEFLGESHLITGLSQDISEGGVFVATYQTLPLGTVVSLGLELPSGRVVVQGRVRWQRSQVEDGDSRPGLGIQFMDLDAHTVAMLTELCRAQPAHYYEL